MADQLEKSVERHFRVAMQRAGCLVYKWVSPGEVGVPDRIVVFPDGRIHFVELKQTHARLGKLQEWQHRRLREHGATVVTLKGREQVDRYVEETTHDL